MSSYLTINDALDKSESSNLKSLKPIYTDLMKIELKLKEFTPVGSENYDCLNQHEDVEMLNKLEIIKEMETIKDKWTEQVKKHRDVHNLISKYGKTSEKVFFEKIDHLNDYFEDMKSEDYQNLYNDSINTLIFDYLIRVGLVDVAAVFLEENEVHSTSNDQELLAEVTVVIDSMKNNEFQPLKDWIQKNKENLNESRIIEFHYIIYKLEFLNVLSREPDNFDMLINCAKKMALYARFFQPDFEYIMGSMAFIHNPERIRQFYSELFERLDDLQIDDSAAMDVVDNNHRSTNVNACHGDIPQRNLSTENITLSLYYQHFLRELIQMFAQQVCNIKQSCCHDPLITLFNSGIRNITEFYNHDQIRKKLSIYNKISDFPLTVKNPESDLYHSIFHCPVDKCVVNGKNCVLRLKCGHAISKSAFTQLTKNEQKTKMKCPYCPYETKTSDALTLIL